MGEGGRRAQHGRATPLGATPPGRGARCCLGQWPRGQGRGGRSPGGRRGDGRGEGRGGEGWGGQREGAWRGPTRRWQRRQRPRTPQRRCQTQGTDQWMGARRRPPRRVRVIRLGVRDFGERPACLLRLGTAVRRPAIHGGARASLPDRCRCRLASQSHSGTPTRGWRAGRAERGSGGSRRGTAELQTVPLPGTWRGGTIAR